MSTIDDLTARVGELVLVADNTSAALLDAQRAIRTLADALDKIEDIAQDSMDLGRSDLSSILNICNSLRVTYAKKGEPIPRAVGAALPQDPFDSLS